MTWLPLVNGGISFGESVEAVKGIVGSRDLLARQWSCQ